MHNAPVRPTAGAGARMYSASAVVVATATVLTAIVVAILLAPLATSSRRVDVQLRRPPGPLPRPA
eukprot:5130213-Alexandrium_andersonii.AAC.1